MVVAYIRRTVLILTATAATSLINKRLKVGSVYNVCGMVGISLDKRTGKAYYFI